MSDYLLNLTHFFGCVYPPSSAVDRIVFSGNFGRFSGFFRLIAAAVTLFELPGLLLLCLCSLPASVWGDALRLCPPPSQRKRGSISSTAQFSRRRAKRAKPDMLVHVCVLKNPYNFNETQLLRKVGAKLDRSVAYMLYI